MAELEDNDPFKEFGGSIITKQKEEKDPFAEFGGKTLKKKVKSDTGGQSSVIGSTNPLNPARENVPGSFNFAESVNPEMYNEVQEANKIAKENQSARLSQIEQAYSGNKKAIQAAKRSPLKDEQLIQGVPDSDRKGNRAVYIYNELLNGVGSIAAGLGDVALQAAEYSPNAALSSISNTEVLNQYRSEAAPTIRNFLTEKIGGDLDKGLKSKYQNETFTAALGGLSQSVPAIAATIASGGVGTGAMFLQSYDNALASIDQTEEGRNLDNATKTYFATGVGIVTAALEKFGLDRIFKGNTGLIGNLITKQALKKATASTGGKVTGDVFTKFMDMEVANLRNKYVTAGVRGLDGALIEYGTEALQEGAQAGAELLLNEKTGKPVFDTSNSDDWIKFTSRMHKAGVMGAIGGGLLGGVAGIARLNKNQLNDTQASLDEVNAALENENLSESSQRILIDNKIKLEEEIDDASNKIDEAFDKLDDSQKERVIDITDRKVEINEALNDPAIPDSVKETLNTENETLDKELEAIAPKLPEGYNIVDQETITKKGDYDLYHTGDGGLTIEDVSVEPRATRQGYKGQYGGFYTYDNIGDVEKFSQGNNTKSTYGIKLKEGTNIVEYDGSIERLDAKKLQELRDKGYQVIRGKSILGKPETIIIDKNAIESITDINASKEVSQSTEQEVSELENTMSEAQEMIVQMEQMAELETDPVEKAELIENIESAKDLVEKSQTEINNLKQEEVTEVKPKKPVFTIKGEEVKPKEETKDATKIGKQSKSSITEREGATEQQQGKQEDRINKEEPISKTKAETGSSDSTKQGGTEQKVSESFSELTHRDISSEELSETLSNKERESGKELTLEEKQYRVTKVLDSLNHGNEVVEQSKKEFGDEYVSKLLNYVKDNASTLDVDKQSLILISLENNLEKQLLDDPNNLTLQKQTKMVTNELLKRQRGVAKAVGLGRLRQIARLGYDIDAVTSEFFTPAQKEARTKLVKAVESTSEDIQKEYESEIEEEVTTPDMEQAIADGIDKKINELYQKLPSSRKEKVDKAIEALDKIQKRLRSRTYDATIGVPIAIIDAGITTIKAAIKAGVSVADAIELGINKIKERHNKEWKKEDVFRKDMLSEFKKEGIETTSGKRVMSEETKRKIYKKQLENRIAELGEQIDAGVKKKTTKVDKYENDSEIARLRKIRDTKKAQLDEIFTTSDIVKQALIDAGYSREITVNTKEGKQKREILDWKKLTGEEGSLDNINAVIDKVLGKKGYSKSEINNIKQALKDEYNDLHASIIEKAENELATRNKERTPAERKSSAKRLAELYNYGLFEKDSDTYDRLINSAVGLSQLSNDSFIKAKELAKSLASLYAQRDANGKIMPEITFKKAVRSINNEIEALLTNVVSDEASWKYKAVDRVGEYFNINQRFMLVTMKQLLENPLAGYIERAAMGLGYRMMGDKPTDALSKKEKQLARVQFTDIVINAGNDYGDVTTPFLSKSKVMDAISKASDNQLYHWAASVATGRIFLEGADSMHKIALTEKMFIYNLIRILRKKGMSKEDATNFVSDKLTGQSFSNAVVQAKELIKRINTEAGSKVLPDNESNVFLLANDIVKNALLLGNEFTLKEVEASHKAAYKAAGLGMGHEANNLISKNLVEGNKNIQYNLKKAIKEKDWATATTYRILSIVMNNFMNPFVGGGTNWMYLTATKAGINPFAYYTMLTKTRDIDLTSDTGIKNLELDLFRSLERRNETIRGLIVASVGLSIYAAAVGSGADEPIAEWLKKNKWAQVFFNKVSPPALAGAIAQENGEMDKFLLTMVGAKNDDFFSDQRKFQKAVKYFVDNSPAQKILSKGAIGDLIGGKLNVPVLPWRMYKDIDNIYRGLNGIEPVKIDYNTRGFWNGFFKGGLIDYIGYRPEGEESKPLTKEEIDKMFKEMDKQLKEQRKQQNK